MKDWLKAIRDPGRISRRGKTQGRQWLEITGSEYLFTLRLQNVANPLDDGGLWDSKYGGQDDIRAKVGERQLSNRLYEALRDHNRVVKKVDSAQAGRFDYDHRVFTDVVVWIPQRTWQISARQGGYELQITANRLAYSHYQDFRDRLLYPERKPRYCIMPDASLKDGDVVCQFGLAVFVPGVDDVQTAELWLRKDGKSYPLPKWIFYEDGKRVERPFGKYQQQEYLQLGGEILHTCPPVPVWFGHGKGYLQLCLPGGGQSDIYDSRQFYGDDEYVTADDPSIGFGGRVVCPFLEKDGRERLELEVIPFRDALEHVSLEEKSAASILNGLTLMPSRRKDPLADRFLLAVRGIVLPKLLPDLPADLSGWELLFDRQGVKPPMKTEGVVSHLRLFVNRQTNCLLCEKDGDDLPYSLDVPVELTCDGIPFRLHVAPVSVEQYALLELPYPQVLPLGDGLSTLGRADGSHSLPEGVNGHIPLDLLDQPGTLKGTNGEHYPRTLNYLGLSAHHAVVHVRDGEFYVRQVSASSPIYVLSADNSLQTCLPAGEDREVKVDINGQLLVGNYWLQFRKQDNV